ncbi:hypothetical protein ACOBV8_06720 [Pseudoalteromonas espejiana]
MKTSFVIIFIIFQLVGFKLHASEPDNSIQILLINATNQDMPWQKSVELGLRKELSSRNYGFDLFVENMDVGRFNEGTQKHIVGTYLKQKYKNKPIDIIITQSPSAAALLSELTDFYATGSKNIFRARSAIYAA